MTVEQRDAFGEHVEVEEVKIESGGVAWVGASVVWEHGADGALKLLGVPRKGTALQDWRDEMTRRSGGDVAAFRKWVDWETNILGNNHLASFIWAIA